MNTYGDNVINLCKNDEIWYTSIDRAPISLYRCTQYKILFHTYENGKGIIKFDRELKEIEDCCFWNNLKLKTIIIPNSVNIIGESAFKLCCNLSSIVLSSNLELIGASAFYGCTNLRQISFPDSTTKIGPYSFGSCKKLNSIKLNQIETIGMGAFSFCTALNTVYASPKVTSIGIDAFISCDNITTVCVDDLVSWCNINFESSRSNPMFGANISLDGGVSHIKELILPFGITEIKDYAFEGCIGIEKIHIPSSVKKIGMRAFYGMTPILSNIIVPNSIVELDGSAFGKSVNLFCGDYVYSEGKSIIINGCLMSFIDEEVSTYTIPNNVTSIGDSVFYKHTNLKKVIIPKSVRHIGNSAFYGCSNLEDITIPDSVTEIGYSAFEYCSKLSHITIPSSVKWIGYRAFKNCKSLSSVNWSKSNTHIDIETFLECHSLTSIDIPDSVMHIDYSAFANCKSLRRIVIGSGIEDIRGEAFYGCTDLREISIKSSTPPECHEDAFISFRDIDILSKCEIIVPSSSIIVYKSVMFWRKYANNIVGINIAKQPIPNDENLSNKESGSFLRKLFRGIFNN